ncbi:MAG: sodium:solute symporter family transporter [Planctomycetota bacterium]
MKLSPADIAIVAAYLLAMAWVGIWLKRRATKGLDSFYLADRGLPWWVLGLSGCSSYIDIGGTMGMVGILYYLGLKGLWATHLFWGWFIICFYMAFQAKWIRRSGVMTFAEWNESRFGPGRATEGARLAAAVFLLVLMVANLTYMSVGVGKFGEVVLGVERWQAVLAIYLVVGVYVTLGGFFGVIYTDVLQTVLIFAGAVVFAALAFGTEAAPRLVASKDPAWSSLAPAWTLWSGYAQEASDAYRHFQFLGPVLLAGTFWCVFRVLAGPNVWDFQFFLTARSARDAASAAGLWTVGYTARWVIGCSLLVLGFEHLGPAAGRDAERIMPEVLSRLSDGLRGCVIAILLAALMSTLSAMINVTSSVVVNDFLKRYFARGLPERRLVRWGQVASVVALLVAFGLSQLFRDVVTIWETMIFVVVSVILVPATLRWHWWRFGPGAFAWAMALSAAFIALRIAFLGKFLAGAFGADALPAHWALAIDTAACLAITLAVAHSPLSRPAPMDALVEFYARVRPFGFWGPVRREAVRRGLVPERDPMPAIDIANGFLTAAFQFSLAALPFSALIERWRDAALWALAALALAAILYVTWYRTLPTADEGA